MSEIVDPGAEHDAIPVFDPWPVVDLGPDQASGSGSGSAAGPDLPPDFDDTDDVTICGDVGLAWCWDPPRDEFPHDSRSSGDVPSLIDSGSCDSITLALIAPPPAPVPAGARSLSSIAVTPTLSAISHLDSASGESRRRSARLSQLFGVIRSESTSASVSVSLRDDQGNIFSSEELEPVLTPAPAPPPEPVAEHTTTRSQSEWLTWSIAALTPTVGPEGVADLLAEAMSDAWLRGERSRAEDWLEREPMLRQHPQAAIRLIYEELCLRREDGEALDHAELARRFPQWRDELAALLAVEGLVPEAQPVTFPELGTSIGDFRLVAELGRGALGRAFLAVETTLADRQVVVKLTPRDHHVEHLSLARLQHTNIVPLYGVRDFPEKDLRALLMPYLGGASMERILHILSGVPHEKRTGLSLLRALDVVQAGILIGGDRDAEANNAGRAARFRKVLAGYDYPEAIALIGSYLADALHYAHERGLVHMDVKPSNVLIGDDGQPSLLDFHLARPPYNLGDPRPDILGGTPDYMSPEQREALAAVREGVAPPRAVDGRSDIYSLAMVLLEALGGRGHPPLEAARTIRDTNERVSVGLADILVRCLAEDPEDRYPDAASLAEDLRAHVRGLPLRGVTNRSVAERFQKWRTRRQRSTDLILHWLRFLLVVTVLAGIPLVTVRVHDARNSLDEARKLAGRGEQREAISEYEGGLNSLGPLPFGRGIRAELADGKHLSRLAQSVGEFADRARFLAARLEPSPAPLPLAAAAFDQEFKTFWQSRSKLRIELLRRDGSGIYQGLRRDILDLVLIDAQVRPRLLGDDPDAGKVARAILDEATELLGDEPVLLSLRAIVGGGRINILPSPSAWELTGHGRIAYLAGDLGAASDAFDRAITLAPDTFWAQFFQAQAALRQDQPPRALAHTRAAQALRPGCPEVMALLKKLENGTR